jgi:hypothetical protein
MRANLFVEQAALDFEQCFKRRLGGSLGRDIFHEDQRGRSIPQEVGGAMWLWVSTSLSCTERTEVAIAA